VHNDNKIKHIDLMTPPCLGPSNKLVFPLLNPDPLLAHHTPTHTTVGGYDFVWDESIAYALKLRDSDINVTFDVVPGVPLGFVWNYEAKATIQWLRNQVRAFQRAFKKEQFGYSKLTYLIFFDYFR
jgi:acetyl esterase/lipase